MASTPAHIKGCTLEEQKAGSLSLRQLWDCSEGGHNEPLGWVAPATR